MSEKENRSFGDRLKTWLHLGQEEIVRTSQLGRELIKGSLLHDELKTAYQSLGRAVFAHWQTGAKQFDIKTQESIIEKISKLEKEVREEESKIDSIKSRSRMSV